MICFTIVARTRPEARTPSARREARRNKKGNKEESAEEKEAREQKRKIENEAKKAEFHVVVHANTLVLIHSFICVSPALSLSLSLDLI